MPVPGFKYDVFLSYARADDMADGWVGKFEQRLKAYLLEYQVAVEIFRDVRNLDVNQRFDAAIKEALKASAVLIPIISPRFQESAYCRQEVHWFFEAARNGIGATVGPAHHNRNFNVLRFNVGFNQWLSDLSGVNAIRFFKAERSLGSPIDPDSSEGIELLRNLAEQVAKTLELMTSNPAPAGTGAHRSHNDPLTVYLPETDGDMRFDQEELCTSFQHADPSIRLRQDPASKPALIEGFRSADLSIVLADEEPGPDTLTQLELADVYASRWIVAVHPSVRLTDPPRDEYYARLMALREGAGKRNHAFLHHPSDSDEATLAVDEVVEESLALLRKIVRPSQIKTLMLDTHPTDRALGRIIKRYLATRKVGTKWPVGDGQPLSEAYLHYQEVFNQCRAAMLVYGASDKKWVENRLDEVKKVCRDFREIEKPVGVFYGPPLENKPRFGATIEVSRAFLLKLDDIDYSRDWKNEIDKFLERAGL